MLGTLGRALWKCYNVFKMPIIEKLGAKEILDSRGNPTVFASCALLGGAEGSAAVPSGASTGMHEACELRDGDMKRFKGKGVLKAVENVNGEISKFLIGKEISQNELDESLIKLDGTKNKSRLGANAILAVSLAFARACAKGKGIELYEHLANLYYGKEEKRKYKIPQPAFNVINGGKHSDSGLSFQEFMLVPTAFKTIKEKVEVANKIIKTLRSLLVKDNQSVTLGDEGGFAPKLSTNEEALKYLETAISSAGYDTNQVKVGLDVAASTFFKNGQYVFEDKKLNTEEMINFYQELCARYKIISIEDGLDEEDFKGFAQMEGKLGGQINIVGDDLTVTNVELIKKAIENKSINTLLVKPNQIGTLSETLQAIRMAKENNIKIFVSHRSGETLDTFISDLSAAVQADYIKAGATTREERIVKYDRLTAIEEHSLVINVV